MKIEELQCKSDLELNIELAKLINRYKGNVGKYMPNAVKLADEDFPMLYLEVDFCKKTGMNYSLCFRNLV